MKQPRRPTATPFQRRAAWLLCSLAVLLAGCSDQELYSQLTERQANEMVAVLRAAGIAAEKQSHEGRYAVLTSRSDFSQAVRTLNAQGYPRETFDTMGKVFKREGFVSSPLEERARLVHAMSQEISNTIANIDGVITARVHLVVPERNPLADKPQPAAASVFIKHRPDKNLAAQTAQIKALVVNSIEGLAYDNVTVALFPAEGLSSEPAAVPTHPANPTEDRAAALLVPLLAGGGAGVLALGGGGVLWWRRRGDRRGGSLALPQPAPAARAAAPQRPVSGELQAAFRRTLNTKGAPK